MEASVVNENGSDFLVVKVPLFKGRLSASQKSLTVASTGGGKKTEAKAEGKVITVNVSAWIAKD